MQIPIPTGWTRAIIQNLVDEKIIDKPIDGNHGSIHPKSEDFVSKGVPFIMASDIVNNKINFDHCAFISEELNDGLQKGFALPGDVLLSHKATIGRTAIVGNEYQTITLTPQLTYYRVLDNSKLNNYYLFYYFNSPYFQNILNSWAGSGSTRAYLGITDQRKLPILLPPPPEQRAIADILLSFDAKIELLREQNETIEKTAQTIFHEWFGRYSFDTPEGLPEGWRVGKLGEEFEIVMGQSPDGESYNQTGNGAIFFQGRTDFTHRFPNTRLYTTEPKRLAEKFDVLVSVRAPVGDINVAIETCCIGRGLAAVKSKFKSYCLYKIKSLRESFDKFESEGTVFGSINKDAFFNIETLIPTQEMIIGFENIVKPMDEKFFNNYQAIQCLIKTRDILLPKLMSGEVRVV